MQMNFDAIRGMRKGVNARDVYSFPFLEGVNISLRVLTQDEVLDSVNEGKRKVEEKYGNDSIGTTVDDYMCRELLYRAILDDSGNKFFSSPEQVGELSADEVVSLLEFYNATQEKYAPTKNIQTEKDFVDMIEEIKKTSPLGMSLSTHTLRKLVLFMADSYQTLPRGNDTISLDANNLEEKPKKKAPVREARLVQTD